MFSAHNFVRTAPRMKLRGRRADSFVEHLLCFTQKVPLIGVDVVSGSIVKLLEQTSLFGVEFNGRLNIHANELVA